MFSEHNCVFWKQLRFLNTIAFLEHECVFRKQSRFLNTLVFSENNSVIRTQLCFQNTIEFSEHNYVFRTQLCFQNTIMFSEHNCVLINENENKEILGWSFSFCSCFRFYHLQPFTTSGVSPKRKDKYRVELIRKKWKTVILLYCFHTAGVLHIFGLYKLSGPGTYFYNRNKFF